MDAGAISRTISHQQMPTATALHPVRLSQTETILSRVPGAEEASEEGNLRSWPEEEPRTGRFHLLGVVSCKAPAAVEDSPTEDVVREETTAVGEEAAHKRRLFLPDRRRSGTLSTVVH